MSNLSYKWNVPSKVSEQSQKLIGVKKMGEDTSVGIIEHKISYIIPPTLSIYHRWDSVTYFC
jgi:hypothetical protein